VGLTKPHLKIYLVKKYFKAQRSWNYSLVGTKQLETIRDLELGMLGVPLG
jgi:hypothetical protein